MKEKTQNVKIGLSIRDKYKDHYTISVRYYEPGVEKFIPSEYQVTREEWRAERGENFHRVKEIKEILAGRVKTAIDRCGDDLTYSRFKLAWEGKKLVSDKTLITLLDEHLLEHPEYKAGNVEAYEYTRNCLKTFEDNGIDLGVHNFETDKDVKQLEGYFKKYFNIGQTTLSMHMRRIKSIAVTGKEKKWIKTDGFEVYEKPKEKRGMVPNTVKDFMLIKSFDCQDKHGVTHPAWMFGRDFYSFMVFCGGMEARSIATIRFCDVFTDYFRFMRAKIENSAEDAGYVYISMKHEFIRHIFETYGKKKGEPYDYVFPFLDKKMSEDQIHAKVKQLAQRITKNVQKIARRLQISPLPNCKRARPTFAILADELGLDIFEAGKMMGHQKVTTTEDYYTYLPVQRKLGISSTYADKLSAKLQALEKGRNIKRKPSGRVKS